MACASPCFFFTSASTFALSALPSALVCTIAWTLTKATFAPAGNGAIGGAAGAMVTGGVAGLVGARWAKDGDAASANVITSSRIVMATAYRDRCRRRPGAPLQAVLRRYPSALLVNRAVERNCGQPDLAAHPSDCRRRDVARLRERRSKAFDGPRHVRKARTVGGLEHLESAGRLITAPAVAADVDLCLAWIRNATRDRIDPGGQRRAVGRRQKYGVAVRMRRVDHGDLQLVVPVPHIPVEDPRRRSRVQMHRLARADEVAGH